MYSSTSNVFSSGNAGGSSFRNNPSGGAKRKSTIIRSQQFRPHTPSVCNRNNDTAEMRLAEEIISQNSEQRPTTLRALDWNKASPRFKPKPPQKSSETVIPACDIGCEEYFQDRVMPSSRRKDCTAFLAPSRDAPFNGGRRGVVAAKEETQISGQIERMESLCRNRQYHRDEAASRLWQAENAVSVERRPQSSPRTPRASFCQFVEEMEMYQQATEWMKQKENEENNNSNSNAKKEQQQEEEEAGEVGGKESSRNADEKSTNQNNKENDKTNNHNNIDPLLQKFYYGRVSDYDAVRKLQEQQYIAATRVTNAGGTALRIRDQKTKSASDPTSFSHSVSPRQRVVRIMDPALEHHNKIRFFRNSSSSSNFGDGSSSGNDFDMINGGSGDGNGGGGSSGHNNNHHLHSSAIGRPIASNYGNYCRQSFYNVPIEIFSHVPTPRMSPRTHSANAAKAREHVEYTRLVAAGKIKPNASTATSTTTTKNIDVEDENNTDNKTGNGEKTSTLSIGLKEAIAAELKKRQQEKRRALAMRQQQKHDLNSFIVPDAPITIRPPSKKYALYKDEDQKLFKQIDPNNSCGVSFGHQSGRERRPLSAGAVSHSGGFNIGMSFETLRRSDEASSTGATHMGCVPMRLPLHEKKPPPVQRITITPKYGYVHASSPAIGFGSPPAPRAPTVYGSPERLREAMAIIDSESIVSQRRGTANRKNKNDTNNDVSNHHGHDFEIPDKVAPPIRTLGAFMPMNAVYDCREPLNIDAGIRMTHPKSIRDIRMPIQTKQEDDEQQAASVTSLPDTTNNNK